MSTVEKNSGRRERPGDPDREHWSQWVGRTVRYVTLSTVPMPLVTGLLWLLSPQYTQLLAISTVTVLLVAGGGLYALLRRRHETAATRIYLGIFGLTVTVCALVLPPVAPAAALAYGLLIVLGYAVLSDAEKTVMTVGCVLAFVGAVVGSQTVTAGWFPSLSGTEVVVVVASFGALALLASSAAYRLMIVGQKQLLAQARADNVEIRQRVEAEREQRAQLQRTADDLERSIQELEQFASIASHDLQEPLRKIQAFGDRLRTRYGSDLDERGHDYVRRMLEAAQRGQRRVNDLLAYSRVTTKGQPFVDTDLERVASQVLSDLGTRIERTGARVEVGDLHAIEADPAQMRQLLRHLLDNALKFRLPGAPAEVRVEGRPLNAGREDWYQLLVQDNGIGFDEKYLYRLFQPFQRLHGRDEYEGTGIGLAICRKIAERHGGSITAVSEPGKGSTFMVTLPTQANLTKVS